jgi:hypothetical protein
MFTSLLVAAVLTTAQPGVTKTTPIEVLTTCRFNAALADEALMNHRVDLSAAVTEIERDGIGGYVVRVDASTHEPDFIGRVAIVCHFPGTARADLALIKPGVPVTIRGVPRALTDHLHFPVDRNVVVTMKDCELVAGPE